MSRWEIPTNSILNTLERYRQYLTSIHLHSVQVFNIKKINIPLYRRKVSGSLIHGKMKQCTSRPRKYCHLQPNHIAFYCVVLYQTFKHKSATTIYLAYQFRFIVVWLVAITLINDKTDRHSRQALAPLQRFLFIIIVIMLRSRSRTHWTFQIFRFLRIVSKGKLQVHNIFNIHRFHVFWLY